MITKVSDHGVFGDTEAMSANAPAVTAPRDTRDTSLSAPTRAYAHRLVAWCEARALFIVAVSVVLILSLAGIPGHFVQDGWLALVAGRVIAEHGIPHHDYFTHMAYGVSWTDQQWLAQLIMYVVERAGGMQLLTVAYVFVTGGAFAAAIAASRRLGGQDLHVLAMLPLGAFFYLATAVSIRTQGLAYPLFIATLYLLASDVRSDEPLKRTFWVIPILILWANLHGSVTLGVGLSMIYGLTYALKQARTNGPRAALNGRVAVFVVLAPLTLFVTPYGTEMIHYYRVTLMNPEFSKLVAEWKPVKSVPVLAVPLALVIAGMLYALVRTAKRTPLFDVLALLMLAVGAVMAVRNVTWFGLASVALLPAAVSKLKHGRPAPLRRARINRNFAIATVALTVLVAGATLARPTQWFTSTYPTNAIPTLRRLVARDHNVKIFADVRYADWLVWEDPQVFAGRVAYDTSFELLTDSQLKSIASLGGKHFDQGSARLLAPYGVWVLNPSNKADNRRLLEQPGVRVALRDSRVLIATHVSASNA